MRAVSLAHDLILILVCSYMLWENSYEGQCIEYLSYSSGVSITERGEVPVFQVFLTSAPVAGLGYRSYAVVSAPGDDLVRFVYLLTDPVH